MGLAQLRQPLNLVRNRGPATIEAKKGCANSSAVFDCCLIHIERGLPPTLRCGHHLNAPQNRRPTTRRCPYYGRLHREIEASINVASTN
jgi:hypothetical protein